MKYSINKINYSKNNNMINSISYNCYDTYCEARGNSIVKFIKNGENYNIYIDNFILKKPHSLLYDKHVYVISKEAEYDIKKIISI